MLRPATPLSILFFVAFVLLLLSTLSTPIIRAIPLASFEGVNYGVFGACTATKCSKIQVGYNPNRLFSTNEDDQFSLPGNTRAALSAILIVHPIAALLTLICFGLSVAAHFHAPAHSPRYLLALLILSFPTLLITLLAFLVDILLFVPHMQWGGWIVLAATILIVASGVVTCAMRRTLVSRKARKKRIAENAEMNGTSYYQNRDQEIQGPEVEQPQYERAESPPPIGDDTKFAQFSSYETASNSAFAKETDTEPLTGHAPSLQANGIERDRSDPYGQQLPHGMGRRPSRDQFGNPLPPAAVAAAEGLPPPGLRQHNSRGSMNSQGSGRSYRSNGSRGPPPGYAGYPARGRGGMGPPRGNYGPRGGYGPQRGGYGPPRGGFGPPRGNYGPPRGNMGPYRGGPQGMRGPPPPGWSGPPDGRSSPGMGVPAAMMVDGIQRDAATRSRPPQNHMDQYYDGQPMPPPGGSSSRHASPAPHPDQVGQAIEMDERVGHAPYNLRDSDSDVAGMLALQQGRSSPGPMANGMSALKSPTSVYSDPRSSAAQPYIPARAQWTGPSPLANGQNTGNPRGVRQGPPSVNHSRTGSDHYYEDVDPRFAVDGPLPSHNGPPSPVPNALTPGAPVQRYPSPAPISPPFHLETPDAMPRSGANNREADPAFEDAATMPDGARSPTESEASHFTSVSQRGVNPQWRPPPGPTLQPPPRKMSHRRDDIVLNANPDFALPGMQSSRGGRGARGAMGSTSGRMTPAAMLPDGRYPTAL